MRVARPKSCDLHRLLRLWFAYVCLVCTVCFPTLSHSGDLTVEYRIGSPEQGFVPFSLGTSLGFQDAPVWFKISIPSQVRAADQVLLVRPVHLDNVQVHLGSPDGEIIAQFGDTLTSERGLSVRRQIIWANRAFSLLEARAHP